MKRSSNRLTKQRRTSSKFSYGENCDKRIKKKSWMCSKCELTFPKQKLLKAHKIEKKCDITKSKVHFWQCKYCEEILQTQKLLKLHKKQHKNDSTEQQKQHHNNDEDEEPTYKFDEIQDLYICGVCSAEFQERAEVEPHIKQHVKRMKCKECNEIFKNAYELGIHSSKHDPNQKIHCPLCSYICSNPNPYSFKAHINYVHLKLFPYYCKTCARGFKQFKTYEEHNNAHTGQKPYVCVVCEKGFTYQKYLHVHQVRNHQVGITGNKIENECRTCNRYFYKPEALKDHVDVCYKKRKKVKSDTPIKAFLCDSCGQTFTEKAKLLEHLRVHKGDLPFVCSWCGKRFPVKAYLKTHERVHTGEKPYSCEYCGKRFGHHAPFRVHRRTHTGERPYVCDFCNKGFTTNQGLKLHKRNCPDNQYGKVRNLYLGQATNCARSNLSHPRRSRRRITNNHRKGDTLKYLKSEIESDGYNSFECKICKTTFLTSDLSYQHQCECKSAFYPKSANDYETASQRTCKECQSTFITIKQFREHRKKLHASSLKEYVEEHTFSFDELQEIFICNTCSAEFKEKYEAEVHLKSHKEVFDCSLCNRKFQTLFQLGNHLKNSHNENEEFTCPLCSELSFPKASLLIKHINVKHQNSYLFNCNICSKGFNSRTLWIEHSNIHAGLKPFVCVVCDARFTYSKSVTTHQLRTHRVEILGKDHRTECTFCKNRFVSIASLQRHIQQIHNKPRPPKEKSHLCDICGMAFTKKNKMAIHQRTHTGVRPYPCQFCEKSFSKSGERNCHERIHTGERPYNCEYCGQKFRQSAPFKVHIRTHTGERPYVCDLCSKGFTTNQGLKLHRKNCGNLATMYSV